MKENYRLSIGDTLIDDCGISISKKSFIPGPVKKNNYPHSHDYYEIEFITSGSMLTEINGKEYELSDGDFIFLTPSDVHRYIEITCDEVKFINLTFIPHIVEYSPFASSVLSGKCIISKLTADTKKDFIFLINKLQSESQGNKQLRKRYISHLLSCLLIEMKRVKGSDFIDDDELSGKTVTKALIYIKNNFTKPISLDDVAKAMNVSPVYASKLIQEALGYGFKEYLMDMRLEYATSLLSYTEEDITEIAYYSGYNSVSYFSRGFKKKYGMSPAEFRRKNAKRT